MKLSIVITHYNEPWETCKPMFDSLALQFPADVLEDTEIMVIEDGREDNLNDDCFKPYPFTVKHYTKKHEGVSAARNYGLDKAKGDYVMFCDCDDCFISSFGLRLIREKIKEEPDMIFGCFMEETRTTDGEYALNRRDKDSTFVHGKVFNRKYLRNYNIRFDPALTIHEDSYFVSIASSMTDNKAEITMPFYLWKWNPNSVVRRDRDHIILRTYKNIMDCRLAICRELKRREEIDTFYNVVCKTVADAYYDSNKPEWLDPENADLVKAAEKEFKRFYDEFGDDYKECNINRIAEILFVCRQMAFSNGLRVEQHTLNEWLNHIVKDC